MGQTICTNSLLKQNTTLQYEKAIYFDNAYFSQQGTSTETWENVFDDNLATKKRLDGSMLSAPLFWYYNSGVGQSAKDISGNYLSSTLFANVSPSGVPNVGIIDCDALPLRMISDDIETNAKTIYKAFPNPAADYFMVEATGESTNEFEIVLNDITGRTVQIIKSNLRFTHVNTMQIQNGFYGLTIHENGKLVATTKIIIQR